MLSSYPKYRPDIDGLRAIAVLAVVGFHAFPNLLKGGFIGVDIFFVISGFLISTIIFASLEQDTFRITEFYSRRIKRIFPALLLVLLSCYFFGWFALFGHEYKQLGKHIFSGASFIANIILWSENGYFDNAAETKPLLHLWSLGIEEQFYIIWPLLLFVAWKRKMKILPIIVMVCFFSFALNISRVHRNVIEAFYAPQTRFWELLLGSLLAYLSLYPLKLRLQRNNRLSKILASPNLRSILGAMLLILGILFIIKERAFPGWWALLPCGGAVLIISAGPSAWVNRKILSNKMLVWFGLISFPLYLWHWPLLTFARIVEGGVPAAGIRLLLVFLSITLAWLTYEWIEKPIRHRGQKSLVMSLLLLMTVVGSMGFYCYQQNGFSDRAIVKKTEQVNAQFVGPLWRYTKNDYCLKRFPFAEAKAYGWWFCMLTRDEKPNLLLLGNSLANQLYAGLSQNSLFAKFNILSIGTCDPAAVDETKLTKDYNVSPCSGDRPLHQQQFINQIIENNADSLKYAILSIGGGLTNINEPDYILRLKKRVDFLEQRHIKVIIFTLPIAFNTDIHSCFSRPFSSSPAAKCEIGLVKREEVNALFKPVREYFAKSNPNIIFFDQNDLFCDDQKCTMVRNNMPLFRDMIHISEYGSIEVSKIFAKWAAKNVPEMVG